MWYEILVTNEFAEYFINNADFSEASDDEKIALSQMLKKYSNIVEGVTSAWIFPKTTEPDEIREISKRMDPDCRFAFEFCHSRMALTAANSLGEIWNSIPVQDVSSHYAVDRELLDAEQCAVLLMYPFASRMGGSFEEAFQENGGLKKYLCALKDKMDKR